MMTDGKRIIKTNEVTIKGKSKKEVINNHIPEGWELYSIKIIY